jgi:hypothetical protein
MEEKRAFHLNGWEAGRNERIEACNQIDMAKMEAQLREDGLDMASSQIRI